MWRLPHSVYSTTRLDAQSSDRGIRRAIRDRSHWPYCSSWSARASIGCVDHVVFPGACDDRGFHSNRGWVEQWLNEFKSLWWKQVQGHAAQLIREDRGFYIKRGWVEQWLHAPQVIRDVTNSAAEIMTWVINFISLRTESGRYNEVNDWEGNLTQNPLIR